MRQEISVRLPSGDFPSRDTMESNPAMKLWCSFWQVLWWLSQKWPSSEDMKRIRLLNWSLYSSITSTPPGFLAELIILSPAWFKVSIWGIKLCNSFWPGWGLLMKIGPSVVILWEVPVPELLTAETVEKAGLYCISLKLICERNLKLGYTLTWQCISSCC